MTAYTVIVPQHAQEQIQELVDYIANDSVRNAVAWEGRLKAAINNLSDVHTHAIDEDATDRIGGTPLRKIAFEKTYLVHYRVYDAVKAVVVMNVRHGKRTPGPGEP